MEKQPQADGEGGANACLTGCVSSAPDFGGVFGDFCRVDADQQEEPQAGQAEQQGDAQQKPGLKKCSARFQAMLSSTGPSPA